MDAPEPHRTASLEVGSTSHRTAPSPMARVGALALAMLATLLLSGFGSPRDADDAGTRVDAERSTLPSSASRFDRPAAAPDGTRAVVAEYEPVSVDSLPSYGSAAESEEPTGPPALMMVTKGRLARGESLGASLRKKGIQARTVHVIAREMRGVFDFRHSRPGDTYRLGQDANGQVLDFRYSNSPDSSFVLSWTGDAYVVHLEEAELMPELANVAGVVDSSLYEAIRILGEQPQLASDLANIFAWDIDFSRNVQPGDSFQILYERLYRVGDDGDREYVRPGRILAAHYSGEVGDFSVVYFEDNGHGSYFRPDGSSLERAFLAAPLEFSRISSRFSRARAHPILKITRPHRGIDYAAAKGTPIWSVADGTVIYKGWAGASGKLVKVRHSNGYVSFYAHLSKFPKDLVVGQEVAQREVIGYVGDTGLATGPHVCFRVQRNGVYVDPLQIASPAGHSVTAESWSAFRNHRDLLLSDLGGGTLAASDEAL